MIACSGCGLPFTVESCVWRCSACGELLILNDAPRFDPDEVIASERSVWRYRRWFPGLESMSPVSLGEGGTPMVIAEIAGARLWCKLESLNPTGSFKDRGTTLLATVLRHAGVQEVVEDSSGNAGSSLAAYVARARMGVVLFVPESTSEGKLRQSEAYGARIVRVPGPRECAGDAAQEAARLGKVYATHARNPLILAGTATCAFEIWEHERHAPDAVIVPIGQGTLLLGLFRGFQALLRGGWIARLPRLIGVQAERCAPLWARYAGASESEWGPSVAEGIVMRQPLRTAEVLHAVRETNGALLKVSEAAIVEGWRELARAGFHVEPTSAVVVDAVRQMAPCLDGGRIVAVLTGNGLKSAPPVPSL